jgi:hypothetical protein
MTETTSDFPIKRINQWGLKRNYGCPGDGINGIMGALNPSPVANGCCFQKFEAQRGTHSLSQTDLVAANRFIKILIAMRYMWRRCCKWQ